MVETAAPIGLLANFCLFYCLSLRVGQRVEICVDQAVNMFRISVSPIDEALIGTLFNFSEQDTLALWVGQVEGMLDHVVSELVLK